MKDPNSDIPDDWICDVCLSKKGMNSGKFDAKDCDTNVRLIRKRPFERTWQGHSTRQKPPDAGKAKCIGLEEVMKIPLITSTPKSPLKNSSMTKRPAIPSKIDTTLRCDRTPNRKIFTENARIHPEPSKPCKDRVIEKSEPVTKQGPRIIKRTEGGNTNNVAKDIRSKPVAEKLQNVKHAMTWKGGFSIVGITEPIVIEGFQAAYPKGVHPKVYEAAQKMPTVLNVKMVHESAHLFKKTSVDFADVALCFYSQDKTQRSRNMHDKLFEFMELQKAIMIGYVDGIKLFIFTSKQLNADLQSKLSSKVETFLWGVMGRKAKHVCKVKEKLPLVVRSYLGEEETVIGEAREAKAGGGRLRKKRLSEI